MPYSNLYLLPAVTGAVLPLIAAVIYILKNSRKTPMQPSQRSVDILLNRLINETWYNNTEFVTFQIDCFLFDFQGTGAPKSGSKNMDRNTQYDFFDFARTLDLSNQIAIVKLYVWLLQHDIAFSFKFRYNKTLPFLYNWRQRKKPGYLSQLIENTSQDALMTWDLAKDPEAKKRF